MCTDKLVTGEKRKYTNNADAFAPLPPIHIIIKVARKYFYLRDDTTYKACSIFLYINLVLKIFSCDQPLEMRAAARVGPNVVSAMALECEPNPNCGHVAVNASVSKFVEIISILTFGRKDIGDGGITETF
jgi:hypothetical protein